MFRILIRTIVWRVRAIFRSRSELVLKNLALRQQLAIFKDKRPQPRLDNPARAFWVGLRSAWPSWMDALILVRPETVARWHRQGFRLYWRRKSRTRPVGRPRISREVRDLIRRMATDNGWGAPRIHGELVKLGYDISERAVSRYMPRRPTDPDAVKRWMAFLRNHRDVITGVDFFTVPTATFRLLYVFFVIHHERRRVLSFAVTDHPHAEWVVQQLREAFPDDRAPRYVTIDRDGKYGDVVPATLRDWGIEPKRTSPRSSVAVAERHRRTLGAIGTPGIARPRRRDGREPSPSATHRVCRLLQRGPLPPVAGQGHARPSRRDAPTIASREGRRPAPRRRATPSLRVDRGPQSCLTRTRLLMRHRCVRLCSDSEQVCQRHRSAG
jgi:hypothetical protein